MKIGTPDRGYLTNEGPDYSLPPGVDIDSDEAERAMCDCGEYGGLLHRPNCNWVTQRMKVIVPMPDSPDPTTQAANPSHYQGFSNGAQPAFICEHLTWNSGQAVRYL